MDLASRFTLTKKASEMARNEFSKQLHIDKRHIKDQKELKVTWGIIIHGYTEKRTTHHTTKCIRATAGTISFCFADMTSTVAKM